MAQMDNILYRLRLCLVWPGLRNVAVSGIVEHVTQCTLGLGRPVKEKVVMFGKLKLEDMGKFKFALLG
jgi:hypothetical protein